ncbi:MAG: GNAT family N-acetyltransferase [Clostridiales bacterium]|nr:GNAT family N-acetyltransferase [Clostridiales bacterium]
MLDKTIPYSNILMVCPYEKVKDMEPYTLPEGFQYVMADITDTDNWSEIEFSVDEFDTLSDAKEYFKKYYLADEDRLRQRCCFIMTDEGEYVATASAIMLPDMTGTYATLDWVAVKPEYQGRGLGKAIVSKALSLYKNLAPGKDVLLHTQTWSHRAVKIYRSFGFCMTRTFKSEQHKNDYEKSLELLRLRLPGEIVDALEAESVE